MELNYNLKKYPEGRQETATTLGGVELTLAVALDECESPPKHQ